MAEDDEPIAVYKLRVPGEYAGTIVFDDLGGALEDARIWLDEADGPLRVTITKGTIGRADYDALPEFEGY